MKQSKVLSKKNQTTWQLCEFCSKKFKVNRAWQLTCSKLCGYKYQNSKIKRNNINDKKCFRCATSLVNKRIDAVYCSKTCKSMDYAFKRRSSDITHLTIARRRIIIERDKQICYLCHIFVEYNLIELDHLIPASRYGTSEPHNLSVSCRECNRGRGNRIGIEQLVRLLELRPSQ